MKNRTLETGKALFKDVGNLKRDAARVAQDVAEHATAHVDDTKERVTDAFLTARNTVMNQPLALIGIGLAFGFLLGIQFRRSS